MQSQVCRQGGVKPQWNDTLTFNRTTGNRLFINLLDHETMKAHDLIGSTEVDITDIFCKTESTTRWIDLYYENKVSATVRFEIMFQGAPLNQSNFRNGGGGSLMMSKRARKGPNQPPQENPYQQPEEYQPNRQQNQSYNPQNVPQQSYSNNPPPYQQPSPYPNLGINPNNQ